MTSISGNTTWEDILSSLEHLNGTLVPTTTENIVTAPVIDPVQGDMSLIRNDSITNLNITVVEYVPVAAAGIAFTTLVVIGILSIVCFVSTLIYARKKINEFPFFIIVYHMTAANILWVTMVSSSILPLMILNSDGTEGWYNWSARLMDASDQALLYLTLLMTINRFCVFCLPKLIFVFTKVRLMIMCCVVWIYVTFIVYWNVNYGVIRKFDRKKISMQETLLGSNPLTQFFTLCSTVIPLVMLGMYGIIVIVIVKQRGQKTSNSRKRQDRILLWQALTVTVTLELAKLFSLLTPLIAVTTWFAWVWTIFNYSCSIINQIINPVLFLTWNQMIRGTFLKMISLGQWKMESTSDDSKRPRQIFVSATKTAR